MSNDVARPNPVGLTVDLAAFRAGIAESRATTTIAGGKPIMRLLKSGLWVFGQTDEQVQEGSEWAINPNTIQHGYVCWSDYPGNTKNELLGEAMVHVSKHKPPMPAAINGFAFKEQRSFQMKCTNGEDEGIEVIFKTNSIGGMRACDNLFARLEQQIDDDPDHLVAVVQLDSAPYDHIKFGQIFNPIFELMAWDNMDLNDRQPVKKSAAAKAPIVTKVEPVVAAAAARPGAAPRRQRPAVQ